jgi:hypothetical protein
VFRGPVHDFVDIRIWISHDTLNSPSLAQMLARRAVHRDFKDSAEALVNSAGSSAPWVTVVGASAVLGRIAHEMLRLEDDAVAGLYRTTFSAREQFGAGRHPAAGQHLAWGISFSLLIDPAGG